MIQGTTEWHAARLGKVTASKINDVMAKLKGGGEAAGRRNYRAQLVAERLTGEPTETYVNDAMRRGSDMEPLAREAYEFLTGADVVQIGFIDHPTIPMSGCSPDGLIGEKGMLEIKSPNTATHIDWLLGGKVPPEHVNQMRWQMECSGREWCDFASYDPRLPVELQLFVAPRLWVDFAAVAPIRIEVMTFLAEVNEIVGKLRAIAG
jgi:putative phage-type endonuclease